MTCLSFWIHFLQGSSMQVDCVAQIETGQYRENIGLQRGNKQLESDKQDGDAKREDAEEADARREAGKNRQHRVPG